ncbi:enhancer of split mgamma protein-like [Actinia tenebrosa]|uniref:Enhancer of split mgamma protein-like n=1 Tax=Actinia tenebrosa TaxID=6105 RepID=A0A6P8I4S5_ACTTE|nr:enhancer of split mgamma protein-like [Actinia tenebrosa]
MPINADCMNADLYAHKMTDTTLKDDVPKAGKYNKPLLERQRRARINKSLEQIKELILSSLYQDDPKTFAEKNNERMDKAEILEFAVDHIKDLTFMRYASRTTKRTSSPPTLHDQMIEPRLQYLNYSSPTPAMPHTNYLASKRPRLEPQPWMNLIRCTDRCCVQYYGNISPIPSPTLSTDHGDVDEKINEQTKVKESLDYSNSVWRPW